MEVARGPRACIFVPGRACPVDLDEIPLDVCRLCLEAWRVHVESAVVRPVKRELEVSVEGPGPSGADRTRLLALGSPSQPAPAPSLGLMSLSELDKLFWEGKIDVGEYLRRRKELVNSLRREESPFSSLERLLERLESASPEESLFLLEKGKVKAKYPEGSLLPEGLEGSGDALKALQELFSALGGRQLDARLEVGSKRIWLLGRRGKTLVLLVSSPGAGDLEERVKEARRVLDQSDEWDGVLPLVYDVVRGARALEKL